VIELHHLHHEENSMPWKILRGKHFAGPFEFEFTMTGNRLGMPMGWKRKK
jgi:hypothetical protein